METASIGSIFSTIQVTGNDALIIGLVSMGLPAVVALINSHRWSDDVKLLVYVLAAVGAASALYVVQGVDGTEWEPWVGRFLGVATLAGVFFRLMKGGIVSLTERSDEWVGR